MQKFLVAGLLAIALFFSVSIAPAWAFCGFYVAGADAKLFNRSSQVIIARQDNKTILTMANDFQGAVKDFALVVPVPVAIKRHQVKVSKNAIFDKLDAFSQPRLVEYTDRDPCLPPKRRPLRGRGPGGLALGVTVEDRFKVNEYEIVILSAKESGGLETWLRRNGYKIPAGAQEVLQPYIRQQMKFFVAKIDLKEFEKSGSRFLRPLQIAYESPKFMLPIRLGMLNANGEQDLILYLLSPKGQVELTNYRTVKIPTDVQVPEFVKEVFSGFYRDTFRRAYEREDKKVAFLEYVWNTVDCDPCASDPPTLNELQEAGVFWLDLESLDLESMLSFGDEKPMPLKTPWLRRKSTLANNTYITRLHIRYSRDKFAEDLVFQETSNQENFQGRYVLNHPVRTELSCAEAKAYQQRVAERQAAEAQNLAQLTGWQLEDIRKRIKPLS